MKMTNNIKVIGLGGIGSIFIDKLSRYVSFGETSKTKFNITLVDGDHYENKNYERQEFIYLKNKAFSKMEDLNGKFNQDTISLAIDKYVNESNINTIINDGDTIFLCVDNHATRKLVSDYVKTLNNCILISGGNDYIDGNVQVYIRDDGKDITPSLTEYHSEIDNPTDEHPEDMSCEELSNSAPQLYFSNLTVATIMCWVLYSLQQGKFDVKKPEIYFDIELMSIIPKTRIVN